MHIRRSASKEDKLLYLFSRRIIDTDTGCWLFTGSRTGGYGNTSWNEKAHAAAWYLLKGPKRKGYEIAHIRCTRKHCFNPEHLEQLTVKAHRKYDVAVRMGLKRSATC